MEGKLTISRASNDRVYMRLVDEKAAVQFVSAELSLEDFARAVTGEAFILCVLAVKDLHKVGKRVLIKRETVTAPLLQGTESYRAWLQDNYDPNGWEIDDKLNSQGSIVKSSKGAVLTFTKRKWVPEKTIGKGKTASERKK